MTDFIAYYEKFKRDLIKINVSLEIEQIEPLFRYLALLSHWQQAFNLTRFRSQDEIYHYVLLDNLAILPYLTAGNIADIGTGAGLPGLLVAIAKPECNMTLVEPNQKKVTFLRQASFDLGLNNVTIIDKRVQDYQPAALFDTILSRAFSSIHDMIGQCRHLCSDQGCFLLMKGKNFQQELTNLPAEFKLAENHHVSVPGIDKERYLLKIIRG